MTANPMKIKTSSGTWVDVASVPTDLSTFYTKSEVNAKVGLVPIIPTSISVNSGSASVGSNGLITFNGASQVTINGAFTSSYKHFLIEFEMQRSLSGNDLQFRYTRAGAVESGSAYVLGGWYYTTSGTFGNYGSGTQTQQYLGSSYNLNGTMTVHNPMDASKRTLSQWDATAGGTTIMFKSHCYHDIANYFDGFFLFDSGTFNGTINIYGYNNG